MFQIIVSLEDNKSRRISRKMCDVKQSFTDKSTGLTWHTLGQVMDKPWERMLKSGCRGIEFHVERHLKRVSPPVSSGPHASSITSSSSCTRDALDCRSLGLLISFTTFPLDSRKQYREEKWEKKKRFLFKTRVQQVSLPISSLRVHVKQSLCQEQKQAAASTPKLLVDKSWWQRSHATWPSLFLEVQEEEVQMKEASSSLKKKCQANRDTHKHIQYEEWPYIHSQPKCTSMNFVVRRISKSIRRKRPRTHLWTHFSTEGLSFLREALVSPSFFSSSFTLLLPKRVHCTRFLTVLSSKKKMCNTVVGGRCQVSASIIVY